MMADDMPYLSERSFEEAVRAIQAAHPAAAAAHEAMCLAYAGRVLAGLREAIPPRAGWSPRRDRPIPAG
jgi:hypothetical protein